MAAHLHHKLAELHKALLHGRLPRSLHWSEALELIAHLGAVQPTTGGEFAFVVGTEREFFRRPHLAELSLEDISRLRRFLKAAESAAPVPVPVSPGRMIVVIDHHSAHLFHDRGGSRAEDETTVEPYDPYDYHHHVIHRKEAHYQGDRVPEETSFYEAVTQALLGATEIVLIGHGTGKSSAVDTLVTYLKKHRSDIAQRIVATEIADLSAVTNPQVEAIAKRHMGKTLQG